MVERDIIVVGASAGGIESLIGLARGLASGLPASLFVVCHMPSGVRSVLPEILSREGTLLAAHAIDGEPFYPGHIYIAPPDRHLLVGPDRRVRLSTAARENRQRPAIDPLFRAAARHFGPRAIGVILSGSLSDGVAGLIAIREAGGLAVVQDPADAIVADMPQNAVRLAGADHVAPLADLPGLLADLVGRRAAPPRGGAAVDPIDQMQEVVERDMGRQVRDERHGESSAFTCPECGGTLWQTRQSPLIQFRCHVGHVYNSDALLAEQSEALEAALWTAVRTFREKSVLSLQLAHHNRAEGNDASAARFDEQARLADRYSQLILRYVLNGGTEGGAAEADPLPPGGDE